MKKTKLLLILFGFFSFLLLNFYIVKQYQPFEENDLSLNQLSKVYAFDIPEIILPEVTVKPADNWKDCVAGTFEWTDEDGVVHVYEIEGEENTCDGTGSTGCEIEPCEAI